MIAPTLYRKLEVCPKRRSRQRCRRVAENVRRKSPANAAVLECAMDWKAIADVGTAVGTLAAVIVALFGSEIRGLWSRPKLRAVARLRDHSIERTGNGDQGYFLRLWIENQGQEPAASVQVFLDAVSKKQANGTFRTVDEFLPMNLRWAHESSGGPEVFAAISPRIGRQCSVEAVLKSAPAEFTLWTEVGPLNKSNVVSAGTYLLDVKVAAANARPIPQRFELSFTGSGLIVRTRCAERESLSGRFKVGIRRRCGRIKDVRPQALWPAAVTF
jgi:hypothetical protein